MSGNEIKILLVEDNPGDARLIREMLAESQEPRFTIDLVPLLSAGLERLAEGGIDLALLDLGLPDSRGLDTFIQAYARAPKVPFVVLSGLNDEAVALAAVRAGAQDYLVKGQTDGVTLFRAIRYATERKKGEEDLRQVNEMLRQKIEERRAAETAVEAERQRLFALLDGLPGLVYLKAPDFSLKFANRLFRDLCGDWEGKKCYEAIYQREQPCEHCTQYLVMETGAPKVKEVTFAESQQTYQIHSYPFADEDGSSLVLSLGIDISKRKQAEKEVERLASFPELNPHPVLEVNGNGEITYYNAAATMALEELGVSESGELFLPQDLEVILQAIRGGENKKIYCDVQIKDAVFEEYIDVIPRFDVARIRAYNITARKRAEEDLRQSQARLAKAQRIARLGHWECDLQSGQVIWSEEIYRILGLIPEEFTPSLESILNCVHREDKERVSRGLSDTLAGLKPYNLVSRFVRPDGSVRYVHSKVEAVFNENGKPQRLLGTAQDITERRKAEMRLRASEERFRAIFEGAGLGIILWDMEGRIMTANAAQLRMLGGREEELRGKPFLQITHPEDRAREAGLFTEIKAGRRENYQLEKRLLRQNGSDFWVQVTVSLVRGLESEPRCCIGTTEDITARKEAHEKLRESEKNLRLLASQLLTAQEDERRRISRELHDELGQALLVLKLQAKAIEDELQPEQQQIRKECREMRSNLDQVVDNVRRLSRDLSPTMLEDLGLAAAIRRLILDFSRHYHIEYRLQESNIDDLFHPEAQVTIYRLIQECLTNIGKHSQASLLTVAINKTRSSVSFIIQDNGRGFNPAPRRHLATDQGMGLAAMEERARMVGGSLSIWSQEGAGTKVAFDLPYTPKNE